MWEWRNNQWWFFRFRDDGEKITQNGRNYRTEEEYTPTPLQSCIFLKNFFLPIDKKIFIL
jgi:hypothetical protein